MKRVSLALAGLVSISAANASADEWLAGPSRAIERSRSIAHDAPVVELAYGPRPRLRLGTDLAMYTRARRATLRIGGEGFVALEGLSGDSLPNGVGRAGFELGGAWAWQPRWVGPDGVVELGLGLGARRSFVIEGFEPPGPYRTDDVPFGAGGQYFGVDGALRQSPGSRLELESRLGLQLYTNAFLDAVGSHAAASLVADGLGEGARLAVDGELTLRWLVTASLQPVWGVGFDAIDPQDDRAKPLYLMRTLLGAALTGRDAELLPFMDVEAGHGQGLLANRTELRFGVGVRIDAR